MSVQIQEKELITRRESLRRVALLLGLTVAPSWLRLEAQSDSAGVGQGLSEPLLTLAVGMADVIIPRTDTPGALDVGIGEFISEIYLRFMDTKERKRMLYGLERVESLSAEIAGRSFSSLSPVQQHDVLLKLARGPQQDAESFAAFRELTLIGYFTSEQVSKNVFRYDPIPGRYEEIPLSSTGNVAFSG